ncbi:MAG: hypothetical protein NVSMB65_19280 [Chloroflexota bacterium]
MSTIILSLPDELIAKLSPMQERLPELLALSLEQPPLPAALYRSLFPTLVAHPHPSRRDLDALSRPAEAQERLRSLRDRERFGTLLPLERDERDERENSEVQFMAYWVTADPEFATREGNDA